MKTAKTRMLAFAAATALFSIGHAALADELSIMASGGAWQDAQRKAWFEPFSKETGAKILEQEYLGDLGKVKAMVDTGNVPIDLVTVETATVLQGCDAGILERHRLFQDRSARQIHRGFGARLRCRSRCLRRHPRL
ncbi:spermidine/putrescine-binding protein [Mesorhizobium jarvisii]